MPDQVSIAEALKIIEAAAPARLVPPNQYRCGVCKQLGHNRVKCPQVKAPQLPDIGSGKQSRCTQCGRKGHNRRTCSRLPFYYVTRFSSANRAI